MTTIPQQQAESSAPAPGLLGELDRLSGRMRFSVSGLILFLVAFLLVWIHQAIARTTLVIGDGFFGRAGRLILVAVLVIPLIHWLVRHLLRTVLPIGTCRGYKQLLIGPLLLSLLALPLLLVRSIWPEALVFIATNTALSAPDLLAYSWLRRFPPQARVVETKEQLEVYQA